MGAERGYNAKLEKRGGKLVKRDKKATKYSMEAITITNSTRTRNHVVEKENKIMLWIGDSAKGAEISALCKEYCTQ